jgi:hypothetical protein
MLIYNRAIAYAAAIVITLGFAAGGAQAYQCKSSYVQAEAVGKPKFKALKSARTFWSAEAKDKYDLSWSVWNIAANKSTDCNYTGNQWYCIVKAKPCLYVVP